jgi:hypothetical protein
MTAEKQLFVTSDTKQVKTMLRLLLQELDGFAPYKDCRLLENLIFQSRARVDGQRERVVQESRTGRDTKHSKFLLSTMLATLALYVERYSRLCRSASV